MDRGIFGWFVLVEGWLSAGALAGEYVNESGRRIDLLKI